MKYAAVFCIYLIVSANAFGFGDIAKPFKKAGEGIKHGMTQAGKGIAKGGEVVGKGVIKGGEAVGKGMIKVGDGVEHAATDFADHMKDLPGHIKDEFEMVGKHITEIAKEGAEIAKDVSEEIKKGAEMFIEEAKKLAPILNIALDCAITLLKNAKIFKQFQSIYNDPKTIVTNWNPITEELFQICVACSGQSPEKFEWLHKIQLSDRDLEIATCAVDIVQFAEAAVECAAIAEGAVNPNAIIKLINSIIGMAEVCPAAIQDIVDIANGKSAALNMELN